MRRMDLAVLGVAQVSVTAVGRSEVRAACPELPRIEATVCRAALSGGRAEDDRRGWGARAGRSARAGIAGEVLELLIRLARRAGSSIMAFSASGCDDAGVLDFSRSRTVRRRCGLVLKR